MPTVVVSASADASAQGLPAYAGGQVARGGRLGLLGNVDMMDTPFNTTNFTQALIQDQQARSVADVVQNDPSVRVARGFGNYQELYVIRGFAVNSDDLAYNGLYGLLPRQFVASELLERVEVLPRREQLPERRGAGRWRHRRFDQPAAQARPNNDLTQVTAASRPAARVMAPPTSARRFGAEGNAGIRVNAVRRDGDTGDRWRAPRTDGGSRSALTTARDFRLSADIGYQDHKLNGARPSVTVAGGMPCPRRPTPAATGRRNGRSLE
jgi:iron complex outermembrane receptor protein